MDEVQEIKQKIDIVSIIQDYVQLQKAGVNWKGSCPFHNEKTPSFMVNQDRQFYYCFGCSEGGDIFSFIQKIEGMDFPEVLKMLAAKAGVTLKKSKGRATNLKTRLFDVLDLAARYWNHILTTPYGKEALAYVRKRGLDEKTIASFGLGYAPDSWSNAMDFLKKRGFTELEIFQAGLTIKKDRGGYYDRFRNRLVFPISDIHGNVVGFTARALNSDDTAKYINTPETALYHKSYILFGLDKAKKAIRDADLAIVVEGNMDVIASHKVGVQNVVAVSGTALTEDQLNLIKRFTRNIALCFDMDGAGQRAAKRSIEIARSLDMNTKIIQLLAGKDPDECIQQNVALWQKSIDKSVPAMQYYIDRIMNEYDISDVYAKQQAARDVLREIAQVNDPIEKDYWMQEMAKRFSTSLSVLKDEMRKLPKNKVITGQKNQDANVLASKSRRPRTKTQEEVLQERLVSFLLNFPEYISTVSALLEPSVFVQPLEKLYTQLIIWYTENNQMTKEKLSDLLSKQLTEGIEENYLNSLYLFVDKDGSFVEPKERNSEVLMLAKLIKKNYYQQKIQRVQQRLKEAEHNGSAEEINRIMQELQQLLQQKNALTD